MNWMQQISEINKSVTPCPKPPWWKFWKRRHKWYDITYALNTFTHTTADRCERCGLIRVTLADY